MFNTVLGFGSNMMHLAMVSKWEGARERMLLLISVADLGEGPEGSARALILGTEKKK